MPSRYRLLIHKLFQQQVDAYLEKHEDSWNNVVTQFKKIIDSPIHGRMPNLPPQLAGKIFHVHVSGHNIPSRKGFRLIYVVASKQKIILPVFLSLVIKSQFDYDKVPWQDYATEIYKDLNQGNTSVFTEMLLISK